MKITPKQRLILQKMLKMYIVVENIGKNKFRYSLDDGFVSGGMMRKLKNLGYINYFRNWPSTYYKITDMGRKAIEKQS